MLTSRLKILPADKAFKKIITKDSKEDEDVKIFGRSWEQIKSMQQGTYKPNSINLNKKGDYGSDPLGGGKFKMIPSGDIVDLAERNRRLASKDANPDLIEMYKQKFEEAIDNGDKEEMKRWFREIMNHVSFTDALMTREDFQKKLDLKKEKWSLIREYNEAKESGDNNTMIQIQKDLDDVLKKIALIQDAEGDPGYDVRNIEEETTANDYFRKVIVTGKNLQLVLMSLLPNEDIGMEVHEDVDQFFRIDEGDGFCEIKDGEKTPIKDGSSIVIKAGTYHNIIAGDKGLKLYTIYAPPNHPPNREQKTKAEAEAKGE
jgi:mannose-6-phosphate isomerase-like protein (cupin superfamily)